MQFSTKQGALYNNLLLRYNALINKWSCFANDNTCQKLIGNFTQL